MQRLLDLKGKWYPPPSPSQRVLFYLHRRRPSAAARSHSDSASHGKQFCVQLRTASDPSQGEGSRAEGHVAVNPSPPIRIRRPPIAPAQMARGGGASRSSSAASSSSGTSSSASSASPASSSSSSVFTRDGSEQDRSRPLTARPASQSSWRQEGVPERGWKTARPNWHDGSHSSRQIKFATVAKTVTVANTGEGDGGFCRGRRPASPRSSSQAAPVAASCRFSRSRPVSSPGNSTTLELVRLALAMGSSTEVISQAWGSKASVDAGKAKRQQVEARDHAAFHFKNVPGGFHAQSRALSPPHPMDLSAASTPLSCRPLVANSLSSLPPPALISSTFLPLPLSISFSHPPTPPPLSPHLTQAWRWCDPSG